MGGDLADLVEVRREEGEPVLRIKLALQRGWGGLLTVSHRSGLIADAAVSCDGVLVGRTDAQGRITIDRPTAPRELSVEAEGWVARSFSERDLPRFHPPDWSAVPQAWVRLERP